MVEKLVQPAELPTIQRAEWRRDVDNIFHVLELIWSLACDELRMVHQALKQFVTSTFWNLLEGQNFGVGRNQL